MWRCSTMHLLLVALAYPDISNAADMPPIEIDASSRPLFVELVVNGRSSGDIVPLRIVSGRLLVDAEALRRNGLPITGDGEQDVSHLPNIQARYDGALQSLNIDASPDIMPISRIAGDRRPRVPTVADWGAMLNYDAYVSRSGSETSASLWTEQRIFGPLGILSNDGTVRISSGSGNSGYLRYDTRFRYIDEDRALAYTVGDFISHSLPWTTSVRMGGLQISRDYRVRPDLLTMPLPSFAGKTAVPSAVDLFVDGYRQQGANVAPGRFVLDNIPVVNGAGQATIVTTDAVGRQIATTIPFYVSSTLLKPGLLDLSGEVGFLRRNYALRSFGYATPAASATVRRGSTTHLTLEGHGEATNRLGLLGGGVVWAPGRFGTANFSATASASHSRTDLQWFAGYTYTSRRFTVSYQHEERGRNYRDLGSFDQDARSGSSRSDRFIASVNIPHQGSLAVAYIGGKTLDDLETSIATLSYSRPVGEQASFFLSADHDFDRRTTSAQLRLVVPFGRNSIAGGLSQSPGRGVLAQIDYSRSIPSEGGLGVDASAASGQHGDAYGQGTVTWRGRSVELQAGMAVANERTSEWASASGSIVMMQNDVFAARQVTDSFALVSTAGMKDVAVSYENQPLGRTDAKGHLFVPNVTSYQPVRFAIDTLSLSADYLAASVEQRVAVRQGAGAVVSMPVRLVRNVMIVLVDQDGIPLVAGGQVSRTGALDAEIGWDGIAYLEDVADRVDLTVTRPDGTICHATKTIPAAPKALARLGSVTCL
jgi:outer membrane usher protein